MTSPASTNKVTIYTDGGANPNPGPGGWAAILLPSDGQKPQELSGSEANVTNNQMELQAAIEALKALPGPHQIELHTDSQYLRRGVTEWLAGWQRNGWRSSNNQPLKNKTRWQQLNAEIQRHQISWHWTKGHAAFISLPPAPIPVKAKRAAGAPPCATKTRKKVSADRFRPLRPIKCTCKPPFRA